MLEETPDMPMDIVIGAQAISKLTGLSTRQVYHAAACSHLPTFKIGGHICVRRTTLKRFFEYAEAAAWAEATR